MATSINNYTCSGHLGRDPESRFTKDGTEVLSFQIAISKSKKDNTGNWTTKTFWLTIILWGKFAELMKDKLKKGYEVLCIGELNNEEYEDKDGNKRTSLKLFANKVKLIGKGKQTEESGEGEKPTTTLQTDGGQAAEEPEDEDLPF